MTKNTIYIKALFRSILHRDPSENELNYFEQQLAQGLDPRDLPLRFTEVEEFQQISKTIKQLYVPPGHFYSPIVDVDEARAFLEIEGCRSNVNSIDIDHSAMKRAWAELLPFLSDIPFSDEPSFGFKYHFSNPAFGHGDGSIFHAMLRRHRPRRLIEIGSGWSSACALDTIDNYLNSNVDVTFIEPYPSLLVKLIGKDRLAACKVFSDPVQRIDLSIFMQLEAGDFLFIDSTHVMKTGSDVCHELFQILPLLNPGVFIHFHDIFWPFEYGTQWALKENRSWNEIYGLRAFLMYNDTFRVEFFNDWFANKERLLIERDYSVMLKNSGGSIWLRKTK